MGANGVLANPIKEEKEGDTCAPEKRAVPLCVLKPMHDQLRRLLFTFPIPPDAPFQPYPPDD